MAEDKIILNQAKEGQDVKDLDGLMDKLRTSILRLKSDFISEDGKNVDYKNMGKSSSFEEYKNLAAKLAFLPKSCFEDEQEIKAFFINLYNILMIHALVAQQTLPQTPTQVQGMWSRFAYKVGENLFTLDEIEHGILRCNKGHPKDSIPMFEAEDSRQFLVQKNLDPRIHFALNCGANSCPPIRIYQAEKLEKQLDLAAKSFVNQDLQIQNGKVKMSKLLLWYKKDFGQNDDEVLETLLKFVQDADLKVQVEQILKDKTQVEKIEHKDYDWVLNTTN